MNHIQPDTLAINKLTIKTHKYHMVFVLKLLNVLWGKQWVNKFYDVPAAHRETQKIYWEGDGENLQIRDGTGLTRNCNRSLYVDSKHKIQINAAYERSS